MMPVVPAPFAVEADRVAVAVQEHDACDDEDPEEDPHYDPDSGVGARGGIPPAQLRPCCGV